MKTLAKLANKFGWSEANLYQHQAETRIGEASKYLYRYGMGTLAFIFGGGKIGTAIKSIGAVKNSATIAKIGTGIQKLFGADKVTGSKHFRHCIRRCAGKACIS